MSEPTEPKVEPEKATTPPTPPTATVEGKPFDIAVEPQAGTTPGRILPNTPPPAETVEGEKFDAARAMALIDKLRAEIKELKPKAKVADDLTAAEQKRKEDEMSAVQKLQAQVDKAQAELKVAKLKDLRRTAADKVAAELKVDFPVLLIERLKGETPEELEEDAKKILAALPKAQAPKPPNLGPTNPGPGASQAETDAQLLARIRGQSVNIFDPAYAQQHGGGVMTKEK